jgi:hypothetical protein
VRYKIPSLILRYGTITGLIIAILGETLTTISPTYRPLTYYGLGIIIATPITSLTTIATIHVIKHDLKTSILAVLALVIIFTTVIIMLTKS